MRAADTLTVPTSVAAVLLVLDAAAVVVVVRTLLRWWRGVPAVGADSGPLPARTGTSASGLLVPTLTVLPSVPFVPPPRRQLSDLRGTLGSPS